MHEGQAEMTALPNGIEIETREYASSEVFNLVIEATARELAGCLEAIQRRREKANVEGEPQHFSSGLQEAIMVLKKRARELGIPHRVEDQVTTPLDVDPESGR